MQPSNLWDITQEYLYQQDHPDWLLANKIAKRINSAIRDQSLMGQWFTIPDNVQIQGYGTLMMWWNNPTLRKMVFHILKQQWMIRVRWDYDMGKYIWKFRPNIAPSA